MFIVICIWYSLVDVEVVKSLLEAVTPKVIVSLLSNIRPDPDKLLANLNLVVVILSGPSLRDIKSLVELIVTLQSSLKLTLKAFPELLIPLLFLVTKLWVTADSMI